MTRPIDVFDLNPENLIPGTKIDRTVEDLLGILSAEVDGGLVKRSPVVEEEINLHILATIDFTMLKVRERLEKIVSSPDPLDRLDQLDRYLEEITRGQS